MNTPNPGLDFSFGTLCMMYFSVHPEELTMKIAQPLRQIGQGFRVDGKHTGQRS
jgi:hypothetical protein